MKVLVIGGAGFVGLNIAARFLHAGFRVDIFDRAPPPAAVLPALGDAGRSIAFVAGDVSQPETVAAAIKPDIDVIIYGAAITADAARDAAEPERILAVNLGGLVPVLRAARAAGTRRVINLSSGAALGRATEGRTVLDELVPPEPVSLYSVTKFASERVAARLADLWAMDIVSVRLSSVFGPFEYATGVRDTINPLGQIMMAAHRGAPAILARPGVLDWTFAPDIADALVTLATAPRLQHALYNITTGQPWSALAWGQRLAQARPGFECRLAMPGETPTIILHGASERPPLSPARLRDEFGWNARHNLETSLMAFDGWARQWGATLWETV